MLQNLPKEKDAALPLLGQALWYSSLTCLQKTTFQFLPLPGEPAPLLVSSHVTHVPIPVSKPQVPKLPPNSHAGSRCEFYSSGSKLEKKEK